MILKALFLTFAYLMFYNLCLAHDGIILEETSEARLYIAAIIKMSKSNAWISCTGTFIKANYIVTAATCVFGEEVTTLRTLSIRSGETEVWLMNSGNVHYVLETQIYPKFSVESPHEYNLAIVKVDGGIRPKEPISPRFIDSITPNRFCTMMGWEGSNSDQTKGFPLQMFPVAISNDVTCDINLPEAYCSIGKINVSFSECGGMMGAPLFCAGPNISGIVVRDNFCGSSSSVGGSFLSLGEHVKWIEDATKPTPAVVTTAGSIDVSVTKLLIISSPLILAVKLLQ